MKHACGLGNSRAHAEAGLNCVDGRQTTQRVAADVSCDDFVSGFSLKTKRSFRAPLHAFRVTLAGIAYNRFSRVRMQSYCSVLAAFDAPSAPVAFLFVNCYHS